MTQHQQAREPVASSRCPFLEEVTAQYCRAAPFRKLVPGLEIAEQDQRCLSRAWRSCPWVQQQGPSFSRSIHRCGDELVPSGLNAERAFSTGSGERCPFLDEMLVCSCTASPSRKLIPWTVLAVSRCRGDSHRYCDFFLERARPRLPHDAGGQGAPSDWLPQGAARIPIPPGVALAPNHMWLDVGSDGSCHVGVDAFLVRVLGAIDEVTFLSACGPGSPSLVLTVAGTTLPLVFPQPVDITGVHGALRRHLDSLASDPYGRGWLYEGRTLGLRDRTGVDARADGLLREPDTEAWMASEVERLSRLVHEILSRRGGTLGPILADGGAASEALAQHLTRAELLEVFSLFFTSRSE
jgi:glycine cleavage system H lipoate-binding protein